jgi:beta propeller repeat protein
MSGGAGHMTIKQVSMFTRLITLPLLLLLMAGCSSNFSPLQPGTALNEVDTVTATPPTRVLVVGDASSPKLADFLTGKNMEVLDVPYSRYAASDDLKMAGDYIVWSDNRNDTGDGDLDIYAYKISTGKEFVVAKAAGKQWLPSIAGDYIVWEDYRNGNADIYGYQISTATLFAIATEAQNQLSPHTDGVNVVWHDMRNGNADIYRFQLAGAGGAAYPVETGAGEQRYPQVAGDYIVWEHYQSYIDVYRYQISTGIKKNISNAAGSQYQPQLDGDYVVWLDNRGVSEGGGLYAYRLSDDSSTRVASQPGQQLNPRISGNRVVWQDNRNGNFDIYAYELVSNTETRLTSDTTDQTLPQISGDLVTWQDLRHGNYDIYSYSFASASEHRITSDTTAQTHPQVGNGRIVWLDQRRGVTDLFWSVDLGATLGLATNTWLTPAGMIGDISKYDVVVLGNDFVSDAVMLNLYDAAVAAGVGVVGLGGAGKSLASTLAGASRYGISVITTASGCAPMEISAVPTQEQLHPLFSSINVDNLVTLETPEAVTMDELAIKTDASASDSPKTWIVQAIFSGDMCNVAKDALVEFTDGKSKVVLDGTATMADGYLYWSGDRWDLFYNEVSYVKPVKK